MNSQEIFEFVVTKLAAQGEQSGKKILINWETQKHTTQCYYRLDDKKCAFGWLIPDEVYNRNMEYSTAYDLTKFPKECVSTVWKEYLDKHKWIIENELLITKMQNIHDRDSTWESRQHFIEAFGSLTKEFRLEASFMDNINWSSKLQ